MTESAQAPSAQSETAPSETASSETAPPSAADRVAAAYAETEAALSAASERLVSSEAFADFLAFTTSNVLAVVRIANDTADSLVRNLRLAGRRDVARLATQLARTEDKLERLLQEVRELRASVDARREDGGRPGTEAKTIPAKTTPVRASGRPARSGTASGRKNAAKTAATKAAR